MNLFNKLGIEKGDIVLVHSALRRGDPQELYDKLVEAVGDTGTIVVPTFNYDFGSGVPYNHDTTPSQVGKFTNWALEQGWKRSFHPMYSFAWKGMIDDFVNVGKEAFGKYSIFDYLYQLNAKMLFYQTPFDKCTFVHYVEQGMNVDYRFKKYFTGDVTKDGVTWRDTFTSWCRYLDRNVVNDFSRLEKYLGMKWEEDCAVVSCKAVYDEIQSRLQTEPYFLNHDIPNLENQVQTAYYSYPLYDYTQIKDIVEILYPMKRYINSNGTHTALHVLADYLPSLLIREYMPTFKRMTWRVPERFHVDRAVLVHEGKELINYFNNPLSLVAYSPSFTGNVSYEELCKHIHTAEDATPWVFKYYERDWGFCMPKEQFLQLPWGGNYYVDIQTTFDADKPLQVLESSTPDCDGHRKLLLVAHIDHLLQANDDLSGVAVGVEVMRRLNKNPIENATRQVRLLLVPETIGSVCYFSEPHNKDGVDGAIFLEMLGTDGDMHLQMSRTEMSEIDNITMQTMGIDIIETAPFRRLVGNDEIIINGAGINIPTISISRAPFHEYHTDKDTPDIISEDKLQESADLIEKIVKIFCTNYTPVANYEGAPFLSGYGLWEDRENFNDMHNAKVEDIFLCFDRDMSIFEIAQSVGMDYWEVYNYVERFRAKGLVKKLRNEPHT